MESTRTAEVETNESGSADLKDVVKKMRAAGLDVLDHHSIMINDVHEVNLVIKAGVKPHDHVLILVGRGPTEVSAIRSLRQDVAAIGAAHDILRSHLPY